MQIIERLSPVIVGFTDAHGIGAFTEHLGPEGGAERCA